MPRILTALLLLAAFAASLRGDDDFRKGISTHGQWIERLKESFDPRIYYLLAWRSGLEISPEQAGSTCEKLKRHPSRVDQFLQMTGILSDPAAESEKKTNAWRDIFGADAASLNSSHYCLLYTKDQAQQARLLSVCMEKMYRLYEGKFPWAEKLEGRFVIKLYPDRYGYLKNEPNAPAASVAVFFPGKRELVSYVDGRESRKQEADRLIQAFFHEGFHQFFHYHVPAPPPWLDEGLAENFSAISVRGGSLLEGRCVSPYNLAALKKFIKAGNTTPLREFVHLDRESLYAKPDLHYAQSWGLVNFLAHGSPKYRKYYLDVVKMLREGYGSKEAVDKAFANVNWEIFQQAWEAYILSMQEPRREPNSY